MKKLFRLSAWIFLALLAVACADSRMHSFNTQTAAGLKEFLKYSPDRIPFVCAHRGGERDFFPENCIATFGNTIGRVYSMIETDPRYTKDSVIVLMHDPSLERTTNGKGKVIDYTFDQLRKLRLKDSQGNLTDYSIPTLDEALEWARSKTILVLDRKDVPVEERVRMIEKHEAESYAMIIAYSIDEIKRCHELNPEIMMEVFVPDTAQVHKFDLNGIPWENVVAFVSHNLDVDHSVFDAVHKRGALCIAGSSRNYDISWKTNRITDPDELSSKYRKMIDDGVDIIEADLAVEAGIALKALQERRQGSKGKFFK